MAPLILHNVPDDECYVGEDGIRRPYAMIFNAHDGPSGNPRSRRAVAETGSFGKSTRRSRSKTGTPARTRENPTLAAADKLFGDWVSNQASSSSNTSSSGNPGVNPRKATPGSGAQDDAIPQRASVPSSPVELILRGYRCAAQQYAAIAHYESLAGLVLEDYPREPPSSQRRYKSELRDPALTRRRNLTADERALVNRADGGEHWVKVTFESADAGSAAAYASPQRILGHFVYAEPYRGVPPAKDEACPDVDPMDIEEDFQNIHHRARSAPAGFGTTTPRRNHVSGLPTSFNSRLLDLSPADSRATSLTMDTGTMTPSPSTDTLLLEPSLVPTAKLSPLEPMDLDSSSGSKRVNGNGSNGIFCRRIPTARKARLLPAEQALLPQPSVLQRFLNAVPIIKWFSGSMIGNEVPRTEMGDFDWGRASLYWKMIWWFDATFGLFRGDVYNIDKDD